LHLAILTQNGIGGVMDNGVISVYGGTRPLSPDMAIPASSVLLGKITTSGREFIAPNDPNFAGLLFYIDVASGLLRSWGSWVFTGVAAGTPSWFRWTYKNGDNGLASFLLPRIDGDCGSYEDQESSTADIVFPRSDVVVDTKVAFNRVSIGFSNGVV